MKLPTCVIGFVKGNVRVEACGGKEAYVIDDRPIHFLIFVRPTVQPDFNNAVYAVTHLQKKSKCGFLLMSHEKWWQLCFHVWYTFRYQEQMVSDGNAVVNIPGSERVLYWRIGYSRWDAGDCKYVRGAFGTWYGPGLHWD